ncbi:ATP-binding cassette domain-containing protein [Ruminococcus sp. AF42-10]|nr:ATP-binding cassette domain-containing protein [Ruminococcus sp. AF42-10]RGF38881.1 ATP-binding cassette domain-containing protein [Ruminococcus sp. AF42-10]
MSTLEIRNISKTYKKGAVKALDNFNVVLTPGVYGLLGPNGAGKSTLMNIITDNLNADSGDVLYDGENIKKLGKNYRSVLGYMPQQQGLYDDFTLNRFLWYMAALKGLKKKEAKKKISQLLETVNLTDAAHKKLGAFSGGMKQRALIAQALLNEPKILILDEPTAGLDPKERIKIRNFISEIAGDKIVLISTHVVSDIEFIAKEIVLLKGGQLVSHDACNNLTKEIENKVFEMEIEKEKLKYFQDNYRVSNLYHNDDKIVVRLVTDNPPENHKLSPQSPTLEDLYLYIFEQGM